MQTTANDKPAREEQEMKPRGSWPWAVLALLCLICGVGALVKASQVRQQTKLKETINQLVRAHEVRDASSARELALRVLASDPRNDVAHRGLCEALLQQEHYDELASALAAWRKIAAPQPVPVDEFLARAALQRHENAAAVPLFLSALQNPRLEKTNRMATLARLATVLSQLGRWETAAQYWSERIRLGEDVAARVERARAYVHLRQWDAALADLAGVGELAAATDTMKAFLPGFERLEKQLPEIRRLDAEITNTPAQVNLWQARMTAFIQARQWDLALEDAETACRLAPAAASLLIERHFLRRTVLPDAVDDEVLSPPDWPTGDLNSVSFFEAMESGLKHLWALDQSLLDKPNAVGEVVARARQLNEMGQFRLALRDAGRALELNGRDRPAFEAALELDAYRQKVIALTGLGQTERAAEVNRLALERHPQDAELWFFQGKFQQAREAHQESIADFNKSLAANQELARYEAMASSQQTLNASDLSENGRLLTAIQCLEARVLSLRKLDRMELAESDRARSAKLRSMIKE